MPIFANNNSLFIMAVTKAIIAIVIVASMAYCLVTQTPIPDNVIEIILLIIGGYFGYSAKVYHESERNKKQLQRDIQDTIKGVNRNARE